MNGDLSCVEDYERKAHEMLSQDMIDYVFQGTESQTTLRRNIEAFSKYALRLRVLQNIRKVNTSSSYFDGAIRSSLPFFPGSINVSPMYQGALLDVLKVARRFQTPIFISHLAIDKSLKVSELPKLVPKTSSLIWQIYIQQSNVDSIVRQAREAKGWGYKALAVTVDVEMNIKLGSKLPKELSSHKFLNVTPRMIQKLCRASSIPLVVKGVMTSEDAELAIE